MESDAGTELDWRRVEALFPDLLELPAAQRPQFLERHCRGAPRLRAELESLLAAAARGSELDRPVGLVSAAAEAGTTLAAGTRIGAWRIVRLLGRGGMGEVYLGERAEGDFEQHAAIKLMRADAAQHEPRFAAERRILAQLEHPHIARLLDGGLACGRPYMAMEYVVGQNLRDYCAARPLDLATRLALFEQVARAVAYAHTHLVVHRDLKPANILVDADGRAKLLDFGVAKLLDAGSTEATLTAPLTPEHAAPEQLQGRPATTAVDIYALGGVLYELLAGAPPWAARDTPIGSAVEKLLGAEPAAMSRAALAAGEPAVPARLLRGDLDAVVARCLRAAPADRYPTVEALLRDLERWRRHEPVSARSGARSYVALRFLRRHRLTLAAGGAVALALVAGLGVALWQARVATHEARRADAQKEFLLSLFREQDPLARAQANARSPRALIADGVAQAEALGASAPALAAELQSALGGVQVTLDAPEVAVQTLERALARQQAQAGVAAVELARTRDRLAAAYLQVDRWQDAERLLDQAIPVLERHYGAGDLRVGEALGRRVRVLFTRGDREAALTLARAVHAGFVDALGARHPEALSRLFGVAVMLEQMDRLEEAERALRECLAGLDATVGREHLRQVYPATLLADVLRRQGRYDEAASFNEHALAIGRAQLGAQHPTVAQVAMRYGDLRRRQHRHAEALVLLREAEAALAASPGRLAQARLFRGGVHRDQGDYREAEAALRQAVEGFRGALGPSHAMVLQSEIALADVLLQMRRGREAEALLASTLATNLALGAQRDETLLAETRLVLAAALRQRGDAGARALDAEALQAFRGIYGDNHLSTAAAATALALDLVADGAEAALGEAATLLAGVAAQPKAAGEAALQARLQLAYAALARRRGDAAAATAARAEAERWLGQLAAPVAAHLRRDAGAEELLRARR